MRRRLVLGATFGLMMMAIGSSEASSPPQTKTFTDGMLPAVCAAGTETGGACFTLAPHDRYVSLDVTTKVEIGPYVVKKSVPFRLRFADANGLPLQPVVYAEVFCGSVSMKSVPEGAATLIVDPSETNGMNSYGEPCLSADSGEIAAAFYSWNWGF